MASILMAEVARQTQSIEAQITPYVFPVECREKGCRVSITSQYVIDANADILDFWHNEERGFLGVSAKVWAAGSRDTIIQKIHRWFLDVHREMFSRHAAIRYVALKSEVL